jgi:hypothetical protein
MPRIVMWSRKGNATAATDDWQRVLECDAQRAGERTENGRWQRGAGDLGGLLQEPTDEPVQVGLIRYLQKLCRAVQFFRLILAVGSGGAREFQLGIFEFWFID